jgi:DNA-binding NarL/FixJ family response regulator
VGIRVLLCHRRPIVRTGLRAVLAGEPDVDVVGDFADGDAASAAMATAKPAVIVADVAGLGQGEGRLANSARDHSTAVIVLAEQADMDCAQRALQAGATGFLLDSDPPEQITYGVRAVAAGHALLSPAVTSRFITDFAQTPRRNVPDLHAILTPRELEVLRLLASGMSVTRIAEKLFVAEVTVRSHIHHILRKLGLERSFQAVALAYYAGLVNPVSTFVETPEAIINNHGMAFNC